MGEDILSRVIEVEREIQEALRAEEQRLREAVAMAEREAGEEISREEERLRESLAGAVHEAGEGAERRAGKIVEEAQTLAERFAGLDEGFCLEVLRVHLSTILPRVDHDRQDVEG